MAEELLAETRSAGAAALIDGALMDAADVHDDEVLVRERRVGARLTVGMAKLDGEA